MCRRTGIFKETRIITIKIRRHKVGQAYCIKCKSKVDIAGGNVQYASNGAPMEKGTCIICGVKVQRFLNKEERAKLKEQPVAPEGATDSVEKTQSDTDAKV